MTKMFPFIPRLQQHRLKWKMHVHWSGCGRILQNEMCPPWMWLSVSASVQPDWVTKAKEVSTMRDESTWYLGLSLNDKQLLLHSSSQVWASHLIRHHQQTALGKKIHCSNDVLKTRERLSKKKTHEANEVGWTCWNYFCIFFCDSLHDFEVKQNW